MNKKFTKTLVATLIVLVMLTMSFATLATDSTGIVFNNTTSGHNEYQEANAVANNSSNMANTVPNNSNNTTSNSTVLPHTGGEDELGLSLKLPKLLYNTNKTFRWAGFTSSTEEGERDWFGLGETFNITVSWGKNMQAAGFVLSYSSNTVQFVGSDIDEDFYNINNINDKKANIEVQWAALDEIDRTEINFSFKGFNINNKNGDFIGFELDKLDSSFANGNLEMPSIVQTKVATKCVTIMRFGDLNCDGKVNSTDVDLLDEWINKYYNEGPDSAPIIATAFADLNLDGEINGLDYYILRAEVEGDDDIAPVVYGDLNSDGKLNGEDIELMEAHVLGIQDEQESSVLLFNRKQCFAADLNVDGPGILNDNNPVNQTDLALLREVIENVDKETGATSITLPIKTNMIGDINLDGIINEKDLIVLDVYLNPTSEVVEEFNDLQQIAADVNEDQYIDTIDYMIIKEYVNDINTTGSSSITLPTAPMINELKISKDNQYRFVISGLPEGLRYCDLLKGYLNAPDGLHFTTGKDFGDNYDEYDIDEEWIAKLGTYDGLFIRNDEGECTLVGYFLKYGDVNGDAEIDAVDALALIKHINHKIPFSFPISEKAGKVYTDGESKPTAVDALAIVKHANGKYKINQYK